MKVFIDIKYFRNQITIKFYTISRGSYAKCNIIISWK